MSDSVVLSLVKLKLLTAVSGPGVDGRSTWKIDTHSIEDLLDRIHHATTVKYVNPQKNNDLKMAAHKLSAYKLNSAKIVQLVLEGKIRCHSNKEKGLNGLMFSNQSIKLYIKYLQGKKEYLSRSRFADLMNVKPDVINNWVHRGLITPQYSNYSSPYFNKKEVMIFIQSHVDSKQTAKILGVGLLTVQKWTRSGRLCPVSGPGIDDRHTYLYRRDEVEKLSPKNRYTAPQLAKKLGISSPQLNVWIKQGKIKPFTGPGIDGCGRYLFRKDEVDGIMNGQEVQV